MQRVNVHHDFTSSRSFTWRNPLLPRGDPVRGDVRPDGSSPNIHDPCIQRPVQGRHRLGDNPDHPPGPLRHVLRLRHLGDLRAGEERHPAGPGQLLPHPAPERRHLAHRGHADGAAVHLAVSAADDGHHVAQVDAHQGLERPGAGRVQRIHQLDRLDRAVLDDKPSSVEVQEGVKQRRRSCPIFAKCHFRVLFIIIFFLFLCKFLVLEYREGTAYTFICT